METRKKCKEECGQLKFKLSAKIHNIGNQGVTSTRNIGKDEQNQYC